jgi:hypothetical protein
MIVASPFEVVFGRSISTQPVNAKRIQVKKLPLIRFSARMR